MTQQLEAIFCQEFEDEIWSLKTNGGQLLISFRNHDQFKVTFSLLSLENLTYQWHQISFEEDWWVNAIAISKEVGLFQQFNDTQDIEAQSLFALDLKTLEVLWSKEDERYLSSDESQVTLADPEGNASVYDLKNGEASNQGRGEDNTDQISFPALYEEGSASFDTLSQFLSKKGLEVKGSCEYQEAGDIFLIGANISKDHRYEYVFRVFDKEGNELLRDKLYSDIQALATGTFFIVNRAIIFVKENRELSIHRF